MEMGKTLVMEIGKEIGQVLVLGTQGRGFEKEIKEMEMVKALMVLMVMDMGK